VGDGSEQSETTWAVIKPSSLQNYEEILITHGYDIDCKKGKQYLFKNENVRVSIC